MTGRKAFVVGWPVAHSRSPLIHRFWLDRHGINGEYGREAVPPGEIGSFFGSLADRGFLGGNVTLPHKEAAFRACGEVTEVARRLGAVNTLWRDEGRLCGDNTDVYGFTANLDERAPEWRSVGSALLIGAGGAARGVLEALVAAGIGSVAVVNRTPARAEALAVQYGASVRSAGLDALEQLVPEAGIIVNATSAGMAGHEKLALDWSSARTDAIATDIVYVPLVTPFLRGASERGLRVVDGLGMLLHQAVPGFERWFGVRPRVDAQLRALLEADLAG
jgi:shikimate dehydrogenase